LESHRRGGSGRTPGETRTPHRRPAGNRGLWVAGSRRRAAMPGGLALMIELELVGIHNDGETVVLIDAEGRRYQLTIDDALRAAVRRDRPQLEQLRSGRLRPREIQVLIRAGATAAEVAEQG